MRAVTIRQPWASLIVGGPGLAPAKDVENRTWSTSHRGLLLIHAASKHIDLDADTQGLLTPEQVLELPRGGIIGVAYVVDVVTRSPSPWFQGPFGWVLRDARRLPFQRVNGTLGLFQVRPQGATARALRADHALPLVGLGR